MATSFNPANPFADLESDFGPATGIGPICAKKYG